MRTQATTSSQLQANTPLSVRVQDRDILLVRTQAGLFALHDQCPHASQSLATGVVEGTSITCRHHGVQIELASGQILWSMGFRNLPPVETFAVSEDDGVIWVELPD